jgi:type I restriction enzyme S subunit
MNKKFKLDEIVKIAGRVGWKGYTVEDLRDEGPWVIGANDITIDNQLDLSKAKHISREKYEESPEIMIEKDDILIVKVGSTIGKVAIVNKDIGEACINPNSVILKNCKVNPSYLYYYLISPAGQSFLKNNSSASAQSALNQMTLKEMPVELPDEKTQIKVGKILNDLNSKIELNNRINAELEAMAKTIYDYWFVQFDFPHEFKTVKTDKNGRRTELVEVKPYKSSGGTMVWNEKLKREIPEGWEDLLLGDVVESTGTGLNPRDNFILGTGNNYYVTIKNIEQGRVILDNKCDRINDEALEIINKRSDLRVGDILFTSIEPVGITYLILEKPNNWNINESVFTIRPNYDKVTSDFLYMFLSGDYIKSYTKNVAAGSIHKGVRHSILKDCKFILPTKIIINRFTEIIHPILNKIDLIEKENQQLSSLRDWLLPMLMNGQVKVKDEKETELSMAAEPQTNYKSTKK